MRLGGRHIGRADHHAAAPGVTLYRVATSAVGLLLLGQLLLFTGTTDRAYNRYTEVTQTGLREGQEPAIEFLQKFTAPTDCVVTDDLNLAFISRRFPPAMLIDLSNARLVTDSISDNRLERITTRAGCQVVALFTDRIVDYSPGFAVWSEEAFLGTWLGDGNDALWLAQPLADPHPMLPLQIKLGDQVVLQGADLDVDPGQQVLYVSLYWQSLISLTVDYKIFVHLRDGENNTVVNGDHLPYDNLVPTTLAGGWYN
ncbi:MAG: hypothetical protein R2932_23755 [Caldilineaceae bacterium]